MITPMPLRQPVVSKGTGLVTDEWFRWFDLISAAPTTTLVTELTALSTGSDATKAAAATRALAALAADPTLAALLEDLRVLGLL
jgi:hypothetical protein